MNKVITINLAGRAFGVEEEGCETLRAYLASAESTLAQNPDKEEILADIESALAEKCATYLNADKNVVTSNEAATIVREMGPVGEGSTGEGAHAPHASAHPHGSPKRLYRIPEGEWISGVCNGLAAYFDVDVALVRIIFVLLTIFTSGGFCLAYFLMMVIIPVATTPQERAASMGGVPNAQEIIDAVKRAYDTGTSEWRKWEARSHEEKHKWKRAMREERRKWKQERRRHWHYYQNQQYAYRSPFWEFMNNVLGLVWFLVILALCVWSYNHIAVAHEFFNQIPTWLHNAAAWIAARV